MEQSKSPDSSNLFQFSKEQIEKIFNEGLDMNTIFMLEVIAKQIDTGKVYGTAKALGWTQTLTRKQFLTSEGKVSTKGRSLLLFLSGGEVAKFHQKEDKFKTWWNAYPRTAQFKHKGVVFRSVQVKRIKEKECRTLWEECIAEGYTPDQIIQGTMNHFQTAKDLSVKEKENKVQYINNSYTYLSRRAFVDYIEETEEKDIDSVDI